MLPFKCLKCGKVGHYSSKCTYKKEGNEYDDKENRISRKFKKENNFQKKSFYCKEDILSLEDDDIGNNIVWMALMSTFRRYGLDFLL